MDSQVGCLALLQLFSFAARGGLLTAKLPGDTHEQAALAQEEAADVHQHQQEQQTSQAQTHHCAQTKAAEQGVC